MRRSVGAPRRYGRPVLTAATANPPMTVSLGVVLPIVAAVLAIIDSAVRFRRPGGSAILSVLAVVIGVLLLARVFTPVQPYISTTIPGLYLSVALTIVLLVELLVKSARRSSVLWLTILATIAAAAAVVVAYLRIV